MNTKQFYADFAKWAGIQGEINYLNESVYYSEGCPTCGGDYAFTIYVGYTDKYGTSVSTTVNGRLMDFIGSLDD